MIALFYALAGVVLLNIYALALVLLRASVYKVRLYRPMVINIGLSIAPAGVLVVVLLFTALAIPLQSPALLWSAMIIGGIIWVLVLPNAAYLITELNFSHRKPDDPVPLWYDIVQVLTLTLSGVMNSLMNVLLVQMAYILLVEPDEPSPLTSVGSWVLVAVVLILVPFGMYLGRYLRLNSWDITHPASFIKKFFSHFASRDNRIATFGFCLTHSVLLAVLYGIFAVPVLSQL